MKATDMIRIANVRASYQCRTDKYSERHGEINRCFGR